MADTTIYPYGTNGQLPSSIGVINDLTTGGADKALSAEMGKRLALMSGTYAEAWARSKAITSPFCWLWIETVNGAAISKPIWHKGNSVFVDATGAIINVPAASVPSAPTIAGATSGSTVPKNTQITITPASGSVLYYSIDGGNTYQTSDSAVTLTLATAGSVSIVAYCANNAGNSSSATLQVTVAGTAVPTFSPNGGEVARGGSVSISVPSGGELHYKVNSSAWQTASGNSVSVPITGATTIQAYNVQDGDTSSTITKSFTMAALAAPSFSVASGTELPVGSEVLLSAASGATIYYTTNGSTPTTSSTQYTGTAIAVNADLTIKAIAVDQWGSSDVATASYTVAIDHKLQFKIALTGDNSTEYIPVKASGGPRYTMTVDWGDGNTDTFDNRVFTSKQCSHTYSGSAGDEFTITIRGSAIPHLQFGDNSLNNNAALVEVIENTLTCSTELSYSQCENLRSLSADALSNNNSTLAQFYGCTSLASLPDGLLSHLSSNLTSCQSLFRECNVTITAAQMAELKSAIGNCTVFNMMFYNFRGTAAIPDDLFDNVQDGTVTSIANMCAPRYGKSCLATGHAKALYDVLVTKMVSGYTDSNVQNALASDGLYGAEPNTMANIPSSWGGTAS